MIVIKRPPFALYPEEKHWWSFADYGAVLAVMEQLRPRRVLEFGPGSSTLALIEGGAMHVDCLDDNPIWFNVYKERLVERFPRQVGFVFYQWADPLVTAIDDKRYDLALIDGPMSTLQRPAVIAYCLDRCQAVLVPTDDYERGHGPVRMAVSDLAERWGWQVEWIETGALAGTFALMTRQASTAPLETP